MGPIGRPETSVTKYQYTLRKVPEERRSRVHSSLYTSVYRLSADQHYVYVSLSLHKFLKFNFRHAPQVCLFHGTVHAAYVPFIYLM